MVKKPTNDELKAKYRDTVRWPANLYMPELERRLAQRDAFDQHFAAASLGFLTQMMGRTGLDDRTRLTIQIGQFTAGQAPRHLEGTLRIALTGIVPPRDALESIQTALIYGGDIVLQPALDVFESVATELGVIDELAEGQLPLDGAEALRDEATERAEWPADVVADPRLEPLLEIFPWQAVSTGVQGRGIHHLQILKHLHDIDAGYAILWETFAYRHLYSRDVLDDRTRMLCTVGDLLAVNAPASAKEHIRSGLKESVTPREYLELILMSGVYFGFPRKTAFLRVLEEVLNDESRIEELGNPELHPYDAKKS